MQLTRGLTTTIMRYGKRPAFDDAELYESTLRIDVTANVKVATPEDAISLLSLLNGGLGHWVQTYWAGRLLISAHDDDVRAWLVHHRHVLGRAPAELACASSEDALATFLLTDVCPGIFDRHAIEVDSVRLSLEPGETFLVQRIARRDGGEGHLCKHLQPDPFNVWTQGASKTKYCLVQRKKRLGGDEF